MSDTRQQLIDTIDALTPEQQRRALKLLCSLSSGEEEAAPALGDGATDDRLSFMTEPSAADSGEPSQKEIDRRMAALDSFIGGVSHGSLARGIDEELYGT